MQTEHKESICQDDETQMADIIGFDKGVTLDELNDHVGYVKQLVASKKSRRSQKTPTKNL